MFILSRTCYPPPAEKKQALVQARVGVAVSPAPLHLNSQTTQVAILSPPAGRLVTNSCPHFSDIQLFDNGLGSKQNHVLQHRAPVLEVFPGINPFFLNWVD